MLPVLLTLLASTAATPVVAEAPSQDPAVRVWLNKRGYVERTDKVRAYVRTGVDGYVVILHAEPSGRVRVLFPLDPDDDAFVRAGRDYEIRSRADREAFAVYDGHGTGVVLAAVSRDPFRYDGLVLNRHWDYRAVEFGVGNDAEADLLYLVQQLTGGAWFDYDVVRYEVAGQYVTEAATVYRPSLYGPSYAGHYWGDGVGFTITFGSGWYDPWYYSPHYWSWYYPAYWDPWGYYGWYRPYRTYAYYYPYYGYPYYGSPRSWPRSGTYVRHVYPAGYGSGAWGGYAFKSTTDRYGLQPQTVTARRRTTGSDGVYASSPSRTPANATRRTPVAGAPSSSPSSGSLEPRRRPSSTAAGPTVLPTINGRSRTPATPRTEPGRNDTGTDGRRVIGETRRPETTGDVGRRGLEITPPGRTESPAPTRAQPTDRRTVTPSTPTGIRPVEPRRVGESPARPAQGSVGSGRTVKPSTGSLERRTPPRTVTPRSTPTRTVTPPRATPPTRTARPPRATPPTRTAPKAAPARPPVRSSPPARSSSPPTRRKKG